MPITSYRYKQSTYILSLIIIILPLLHFIFRFWSFNLKSACLLKKDSAEAGFGRSLFERLISQNQSKRLLNVQYRMHPAISSFPNSRFYHNQIHDAPIVTRKSYEKRYLPGAMFGPYSFLNVIGGREEKDDDGLSRKNMVEVAIILKILQNLHKGTNSCLRF